MATNAKLIYPELSYQLLGILFKIHSKLGSSYQEKYYQRAIEQELILQKITFKREVPIDVEYSGVKLGKHFLDFVIDNKIILETKAELKGIIANFRTPRLTYRRIINPLINSLTLV